MWEPFLERTGGIAPDLPGFGDSGKPAHFPYSIDGYGRLPRALRRPASASSGVTLVMHDWGAVGLALAQSRPDLVERLVIIACVPLLPGYRWHRFARAWRTPLVGEMTMGFTFRWNMRPDRCRTSWSTTPGATSTTAPSGRSSSSTARRPSASWPRPAQRLGEIDRARRWSSGARTTPTCRWSSPTPPPTRSGGEATVERIEGAGHWPWLDRPELVDMVADFAS